MITVDYTANFCCVFQNIPVFSKAMVKVFRFFSQKAILPCDRAPVWTLLDLFWTFKFPATLAESSYDWASSIKLLLDGLKLYVMCGLCVDFIDDPATWMTSDKQAKLEDLCILFTLKFEVHGNYWRVPGSGEDGLQIWRKPRENGR